MKNVIKNFNINGTVLSVERYGEGHINETYLAVVSAFVSDKIPITANVNGIVSVVRKSFNSFFDC